MNLKIPSDGYEIITKYIDFLQLYFPDACKKNVKLTQLLPFFTVFLVYFPIFSVIVSL